ncbi:hypothetical protein C8R44DRAFT_992881 [Mycena epipterygia]|nr:hypothetical protein C8R44DRAFT_992881 [Mycena epipterygia]
MSLTLPIEAMSQLQVSFKVLLPDGRFSFDMAPNPAPCSPRVSDLKLHFQGTHDETGGVIFTVWVSGLETESDDGATPENSDMYTPSSNYIDDLSETNAADVQAPTIIASTSHPRVPITEPTDIFDDDDPYTTGWPFLDVNQNHQEMLLSQYSDTHLEMAPPLGEPTTPPSPCISSRPPAYHSVSFVAVADLGSGASPSVATSPGTPSSSQSDASCAPSPSSSGEPSSAAPPDPSRPFKCLHADCPLWFKRMYTRRVHMNTHLPGSGRERRFPCTSAGCGMQFSRKHDKLRHEVGNHGMSTQWTCAPCNKFFSSQTTLERHYLDKHSL